MWINIKPSKQKISKIFENIFEIADHQHKGTGVVHQFPETAIFIATPMNKTSLAVNDVGSFTVNLLTENLWVQRKNVLYSYWRHRPCF